VRDVSDVNANSLPTNFAPADLSLTIPTAASITIGGRVSNVSGNGIAVALVKMISLNGDVHTTLTNSFGYYSFTNVTAGSTVVVSVTAKGRSFAVNTQLVTINDNNYQIDFVAEN
jgi:hypothetical protein